MLKKIVMLVVLAGCGWDAPGSIRNQGGRDPILCYKPRAYLHACRDGGGTFWICDTTKPIECMRTDEPSRVFSIAAPAEATP